MFLAVVTVVKVMMRERMVSRGRIMGFLLEFWFFGCFGFLEESSLI